MKAHFTMTALVGLLTTIAPAYTATFTENFDTWTSGQVGTVASSAVKALNGTDFVSNGAEGSSGKVWLQTTKDGANGQTYTASNGTAPSTEGVAVSLEWPIPANSVVTSVSFYEETSATSNWVYIELQAFDGSNWERVPVTTTTHQESMGAIKDGTTGSDSTDTARFDNLTLANYTKMRIRAWSDTNDTTELGVFIDNLEMVYEPIADQTYTSATTTQNETLAAQASTTAIIGLEVVADGINNPFDLTALELATSGLELADGLKIYATGTSNTFATTNLIHTLTNPTGSSQSINLDTPTALNMGTNYFWIACDIKADATKGNTIDIDCTQIAINNGSGAVNQTPTVTSPGNGLTVVCPANQIEFTGASSTGESDKNWDISSNWTSVTDLSGTYPNKGGSGPHSKTAVINGYGNTIDVRATDIEGWTLSLDITDANVYIQTLRKIQYGSISLWDTAITQKINSGGKLIIEGLNSGAHFEPCFDVTPPAGVVFPNDLNVGGEINLNYRLNTEGSVQYNTISDAITHKLTFDIDNLGTGPYIRTVTRPLITWTSTTSAQSVTIAETPTLLDTSETATLNEVATVEEITNIGDYTVFVDGDGIYLTYAMRDPLTPVIGLELAINDDQLTWSATQELGVKSYQVQQLINGTWTTLEELTAGATVYTTTINPNYEVRLTVIDTDGFTQTFSPNVNGLSHFTYTLNAGWNLLSLPLSDVDFSPLFAAIDGAPMIWENGQYQTVETLQPGQAFFVYTPSATEVRISGVRATGELTLVKGWNLVGVTENQIAPSTADIIYTHDQSYQEVLSSETLIQGIGYWIYQK